MALANGFKTGSSVLFHLSALILVPVYGFAPWIEVRSRLRSDTLPRFSLVFRSNLFS